MKHKSKPKKVRRSKAAEGTRGGVEADTQRTVARCGKGLHHPSTVEQVPDLAGVAPGPRAPSPLDELLSDLHLRAPVAREPWLQGIEKALSKFVGELNEIEAAEARI